MITVALLQSADVWFISSDTLKAWLEKVKEQHEIIKNTAMQDYKLVI